MDEKSAKLIADAIYDLSKSLRLLGSGNIDIADAPGAMEQLTDQIKESNERVSISLGDIADSIRDLAHSVEGTKDHAD